MKCLFYHNSPKKLICKPKAAGRGFVKHCCELWREPKDSSQESWAMSSYCPKAGCLTMSEEGDLASLSLLRL